MSLPEPDFLRVTRDAYDRIAGAYAERFHHHLDDKPVDQAMLSAFAGLVATGTNGRVADVGCGTGATTAILRSLGVDPFGIDLSPGMIDRARTLSPGVDFAVGSMIDLDVADGSVGGVCAWYSTIHLPDDRLQPVFAEFSRVLTPGGYVLLAFQVGDAPRVLTEAFGHPVDLAFHRRSVQFIESLLAAAGLTVYTQAVRRPDPEAAESTPQAYLIARKPLVRNA